MNPIIDGDFIKFKAAGEKRKIEAIHKQSGDVHNHDNRTAFKKWLEEYNENRTSPLLYDEFDIVDIQIPETIGYSIYTVKQIIAKSLLKSTGYAKTPYVGYIGKGECFRVADSTIIKYKGNRENQVRAVNIPELEEYMINELGFQVIRGIEADDKCVMDCYKKPDNFIIGVDKDYYGCPVKFFSYDRMDEGIIDCDTFGKLYLHDNGKTKVVRGYGRMFMYYQIASGDASDNYKANSASDVKYGSKSAYKDLKDCQDDRQAFQALVNIYKKLYPAPKIIKGWRGDDIEIDWLYVLSENFNMARMLRFDGDTVSVTDVLNRYRLM